MVEKLDEGVGQLVPEFALPEVLEVEDEGLKLLRSFVSLLRKEIGDIVFTHFDVEILH